MEYRRRLLRQIVLQRLMIFRELLQCEKRWIELLYYWQEKSASICRQGTIIKSFLYSLSLSPCLAVVMTTGCSSSSSTSPLYYIDVGVYISTDRFPLYTRHPYIHNKGANIDY